MLYTISAAAISPHNPGTDDPPSRGAVKRIVWRNVPYAKVWSTVSDLRRQVLTKNKRKRNWLLGADRVETGQNVRV